jgi:hypothetical protein
MEAIQKMQVLVDSLEENIKQSREAEEKAFGELMNLVSELRASQTKTLENLASALKAIHGGKEVRFWDEP